jgi:hypothetical protein
LIIHSFKDRIKDAFTTGWGSEVAHFEDAPSRFDKEPFNSISGTDAFPMLFRTIKERQEFLDIFGHAGYVFGSGETD